MNDEKITLLEGELNRAAGPIPATLPETAQGHLMRVATAAMDFVRGRETSAGWEHLQEVIARAEAFLASLQLPAACRKEALHLFRCDNRECGFPTAPNALDQDCLTCADRWDLRLYEEDFPCFVAAACLQDVADRQEGRQS